MNPSDIFEYANEGMKWLAIGGGTYITYLATLLGLTVVSATFSQKIRTQKELVSIVDEEAKRLGIDKSIISTLHDKLEWCSGKRYDGSYGLHIGGFLAKRSVVRHELYHIFKGDCDEDHNGDYNGLRYQFIKEPRAILYETFGIRL